MLADREFHFYPIIEMGLKRRIGSNKSPPIFSHEFVIANHADIVSCIAMVFVLALLFQATAPFASLFVAMHHNVTDGLYFHFTTQFVCQI